ncbi:hypothetical protein LH61_02965 [Leuconostoc mesenteroides P45]|nr:hypothetical protein LH61_02965 [Leuconostoc mesenteroides P45]
MLTQLLTDPPFSLNTKKASGTQRSTNAFESSKTFADSHDFWGVVETVGRFPTIYLQITSLVVVIILPAFMRKSNR